MEELLQMGDHSPPRRTTSARHIHCNVSLALIRMHEFSQELSTSQIIGHYTLADINLGLNDLGFDTTFTGASLIPVYISTLGNLVSPLDNSDL